MSGDLGIITQRDPDTVGSADVVYNSRERLSPAQADGDLEVAPERVIEVISPNDRWTQINEPGNRGLTPAPDTICKV